MIDTEVEKFTATGAIEAGLIEAVQRGDCVVNGSYRLSKDGYLKFGQNNFVFTDKSGGLRVGRFADSCQLMNFCEEYQLMNYCKEFSKLHGIDDAEGVDYIANEEK